MSVFDSFTNLLSGEEEQGAPLSPSRRAKHPASSMEERREEALKRLYRGVEVKNRKFRLKTYKRCFVGSEAVDYMVSSGWARSRSHAVRIGQQLQQEFNLFEHVVDPDVHKFEDDYLFFRFNAADFDASTRSETSTQRSDEDSVVRASQLNASLMLDDGSKKLGLLSVGEILRKGVNQKYNMKMDREGFYANEAIDYMVSTGLATSRQDAKKIGKALQQAIGVIENATQFGEPFADARQFFYFTDDGSIELNLPTWKKDLEDACIFFKENIKLVDHTYRLKTYKNTFTGKEAVDLFLYAGLTTSRQDAIYLGRALMVEYNLFAHVVDEHEFEDAEFFYSMAGTSTGRKKR